MEFRKSKTELKLNISTALETSCFLDTIQMLVLLGGKKQTMEAIVFQRNPLNLCTLFFYPWICPIQME